jgi:predicted dehydrogenase
MKTMRTFFAFALAAWLLRSVEAQEENEPSEETPPLRIGMIGLDTSHVIAFTQLLNNPQHPNHVPGARVVAGYPGGSLDVEASASRVEKFTAQLQDEWNVEIVEDIPTLCQKVDAVMLMSVDGRPHLEQVRPVFTAKKPVFIDKPMAGSLEDVKEIFRLSEKSGVPCFSSSCYRFLEGLRPPEKLGAVVGCHSYSPATMEPHHPDLFWYGVHGVEALFTVMGPGCVSVTRVGSPGTDVVVGLWEDGRIGTFRGIRDGRRASGVTVFCEKGVHIMEQPRGNIYRGLVQEIVTFFRTGKPPVTPEETIQVFAFMDAADKSKQLGGKPVAIASPR